MGESIRGSELVDLGVAVLFNLVWRSRIMRCMGCMTRG